MFISDLDYLKTISDSQTNSVITGGLSYSEYLQQRRSLKSSSLRQVYLFDQTFSEDGITGESQGGYLTNEEGEVKGVFSASSVSYTSPTTDYYR